MKITLEHLNHGAALAQIAEYPKFTSINRLNVDGAPSRSAFRINGAIGVYLRYATKPKKAYTAREYVFSFSRENLREIRILRQRRPKFFLGLVCVKHREVCCLPYDDLKDLAARRRKAAGPETHLVVIAGIWGKGTHFRVYVNEPGTKGETLGMRTIPRSAWPSRLFE